MNDSNYCQEHGACMEKQSQDRKDIETLKIEVNDIKEELSDIKVKQGHNDEKFISIFADLKEIKQILKEISTSIAKQNENWDVRFKEMESKKDSFKEWLGKVGTKVLETSITGGLIFFIVYVALKLTKIIP